MSLDLDRRGLLGAGLAGAASIGLGTARAPPARRRLRRGAAWRTLRAR
jgi:4-cresol dehydrogenase (hydroxylating)